LQASSYFLFFAKSKLVLRTKVDKKNENTK